MIKVMVLVAVALIAMSFSLTAEERPHPVISDLKVDPSSGPPGTVYTISVRIVSTRDPKDIVAVLHQVREDIESMWLSRLPSNRKGGSVSDPVT